MIRLTGYLDVTDIDAVNFQILFGSGIGRYRGLPDVAATGSDAGELLGTFAWMVGFTHDWNDQLSSNFTYGVDRIDNPTFQPAESLKENTYLAVNLIWNPSERTFVGVAYLWGSRENKDGMRGEANGIQSSFGFYLS